MLRIVNRYKNDSKKYLCIAATLLLLGCNGTDDDQLGMVEATQTEFSEYTQFGVVAIRRKSIDYFDTHATYRGAFGTFGKAEQSFSAAQLLNTYRLAPDTCTITESPDDVLLLDASGIHEYNRGANGELTYLSAGDVITFDSAAGSWYQINKGSKPYFFYNNPDTPLMEPAAESLTLNIPGDAFPAFNDVPVPDVEPLVVLSPLEGSVLQLDTQFSWIPAAQADSYIRITAEKIVGSKNIHFDCMAIDDGEFSLPDTIRAELGDIFKDYKVALNRTAYSSLFTGDSLLMVFHSIAAN